MVTSMEQPRETDESVDIIEPVVSEEDGLLLNHRHQNQRPFRRQTRGQVRNSRNYRDVALMKNSVSGVNKWGDRPDHINSS